MRTIKFVRLTTVTNYLEVLALQEKLFRARIAAVRAERDRRHVNSGGAAAGASTISRSHCNEDVVLFVEHSPEVITMGRRDTSNGLPPNTSLIDTTRGVFFTKPQCHNCVSDGRMQVVKVGRGGGLTWHGPGQIVMYPVVNFFDLFSASQCAAKGSSSVRWFVHVLEHTIIQTIAHCGVHAYPESVGIWAVPRGESVAKKLASIGLSVSSGVSMHGIALNVNNDVSGFEKIIMCEMPGKRAANLVQCVPLNTTGTVQLSPHCLADVLAEKFLAALDAPAGSLRPHWGQLDDAAEDR